MFFIGCIVMSVACYAQIQSKPIWKTNEFALYTDSIVQGKFFAKAPSESEIVSNYQTVYNTKTETAHHWKLSKDISAFPQYKSDYPVTDALYNMALEEMINAVEPDSTFRTGKEWAGVWTRDISYSIILSMAYLQPRVARNSLLRKVKNGKIVQDTGTGGAYPVSTDRIIWAVAARELYKATGDEDWLKQSYIIIKNSVDDDLQNIYDKETGLVKGESSFLDWREQTYPIWMQPADIFESECLGTNAVHYQANMVLFQMAELLHDDASAKKYHTIAKKIKKGINDHLWISSKGYYAQYLYGRNYKIISPRSEALGEALSILFDIANTEKQKQIVSSMPVTAYGISCIYPQIPGVPPYHNNAVWPFVQCYWARAAAKAGNETSVMESIGEVYRAAGLFVTNKENFVADNGDFAGTQINSSNMLWSLSGNISLVHKILFGIEFQTRQLLFHPFVPEPLKGKRSLTNFKYRKALLNIEMHGFGNKIKSFTLDGKLQQTAAIPANLEGTHSIKIILADNLMDGKINKAKNYTSPATPVAEYVNGNITWQSIEGAVQYKIIRNGVSLSSTAGTSIKVQNPDYAEYQVIAVDKKNVQSFISEPVAVNLSEKSKVYELEDVGEISKMQASGFSGKGFVEVSTNKNTSINVTVDIPETGKYAIYFRYANGNGPINTENKCAIRTLKEGDRQLGTIVLPQRGTEKWSEWGYSNPVRVKLSNGKHTITITYEKANENMNGDINQALLDNIRLIKLM